MTAWLALYLAILAVLTIGAALRERSEWRRERKLASDDDKNFADAFSDPMMWGILGLVLAAGLFALVISGSKWPAHSASQIMPPDPLQAVHTCMMQKSGSSWQG